jgi:hypothetical protein
VSTVTRFITYPQTPPFLQTLIPLAGLHSGPYWQYFPEKSGRQEHWNWLPTAQSIQKKKKINKIRALIKLENKFHLSVNLFSIQYIITIKALSMARNAFGGSNI